MSAANNLEAKLRRRIAENAEVVPGSIGDRLQFRLLSCEEDKGEYCLSCQTEPWMTNFVGTLHGGIGATIADQAMGIVSYSLKSGEGMAPTIQLSVDYHRPLHPGEEVIVKVRVVTATRSLMKLTAEAAQASTPEKTALSASGVYFFKASE